MQPLQPGVNFGARVQAPSIFSLFYPLKYVVLRKISDICPFYPLKYVNLRKISDRNGTLMKNKL